MLQANFPAKIVYGENSLEFLSTLKAKRVVIFADEIFHKFNPDVFAAIDSIFDTMGAQHWLYFGEGTEPKGAVYQLSNQVTLGISEKAAIENLKNIAEQLVSQELAAQKRMTESAQTQDKILRSLGVLRYAKLISCDEAMELLSNVRFGISSGIITDITTDSIDSMLEKIQPAVIMVENGDISPEERDVIRAKMVNRL